MTPPEKTAAPGWCCEHHVVDRATHLAEAADWWKSECEQKDREMDSLWRAMIVLAVLCGLCFFVGTLVG